jgi:hypothetical protein
MKLVNDIDEILSDGKLSTQVINSYIRLAEGSRSSCGNDYELDRPDIDRIMFLTEIFL